LARKLIEIRATGRKLGFFGDQNGKPVFDLVYHRTALTDEPIALQRQSLTGVQRAAENLQKVGTDHKWASM